MFLVGILQPWSAEIQKVVNHCKQNGVSLWKLGLLRFCEETRSLSRLSTSSLSASAICLIYCVHSFHVSTYSHFQPPEEMMIKIGLKVF